MRREEVYYSCDCCGAEFEAQPIELEDGNHMHALPPGWIKVQSGIVAQPQPAPVINIKGDYCSVECLRDDLAETTVANESTIDNERGEV